jgi:glycosyltransferase involved in cell wall biosynthesis
MRGREVELERLMGQLNPQLEGQPVEVVIETDNVAMSVGEKRNVLLRRAMGEYIAFVDDDDEVPDYYVSRILAAVAKSRPDVIGFSGLLRLSDGTAEFRHSLRYGGWYTGADGIFYRTPNHLNPVRREWATSVMFVDSRFGEDADYATRIRPYLETEVYVGGPMYYYNCPKMTKEKLYVNASRNG